MASTPNPWLDPALDLSFDLWFDQPIDLAHWVAQGLTGWSPERIDEVAAGDAETRVDLTRRIPVHTAYWTVIPSQPAYIRFVADLYEKDDAIINGLSGGSQTDPE